MTGARILIVEDEPDLADVLQYNLVREGFVVTTESRGDLALESIRKQPPDLLVLDLMLPGLGGIELTKILHRDPATARVPIVMLTAKGEEVDRIVGLELGADDYVTKPFSPREVVLRIKAVLRRREDRAAGSPAGSATDSNTGADGALTVGRLRLDPAAHRVEIGGKDIVLTATEFRLLHLLLERRGRVQTRAKLLADAWGYAQDVDSRTVDTHIRRLRRKLGAEADRIETVVGVGYRLKA